MRKTLAGLAFQTSWMGAGTARKAMAQRPGKWFFVWLAAWCMGSAMAQVPSSPGDEVVLVYNSRMPDSQRVALHYALARHVPPGQIFGFDLTTNETMSRGEFTRDLQIPLAAKLVEKGLWTLGSMQPIHPVRGGPKMEKRVVKSRIRYAVLCYGIPLKIQEQSEGLLQDTGLKRNQAAVDSELSWLPLLETHPSLEGALRNPLYGCTNAEWMTPEHGLLMVARLDGPSFDIANGLVDKAIQAEHDGLWGRAYFDARGLEPHSPYYTGDQWILNGARICRLNGFDVDVDTNSDTYPPSYPLSQIAIYAGWYSSDACGPFAQPKVEFMPGAFGYHLFSFSAASLRTTDQGWCGPLLAKGVTCTMGCVYEPYLQLTPNIAVFLALFCGGQTFGEAAWACQPGLSWQTTVLGDPLYQPFRKSLGEWHHDLTQAKNPLDAWCWEKLINISLARGMSPRSLAAMVENLPDTYKSPVLMEKLAELDEACGKPSSALFDWQRALLLNPTMQQRIRIRRALSARLVEAGRIHDAIANWQDLLKEDPGYPGALIVSESIRELQKQQASSKN